MIQKEIETALGRLILKGEVKDGDAVTVDKEPKAAALKFGVDLHGGAQPGAAAQSDAKTAVV